MVTKFNTAGLVQSGQTKSGGNGVLIFIGLAVAGFLAWKFIIKPKLDEKKANESKH